MQFNPFDPAFRANPYPHYHEMRAADPVHVGPLGYLFVFRYEDAQIILRDPRFGYGDQRPIITARLGEGGLTEQMTRWMLTLDPPDHTRLRRLVSRAFTIRAVEAMRPHIEKIVTEMIGAVAHRGEMDVITDLAFALPSYVIAEMLGVPVEERGHLSRLTNAMAQAFGALQPSAQSCAEGHAAAEALAAHFAALVERRRRSPGDDLLTALIAAEEEGDRLTTDELIATLTLLFGAGFETTMGLIANGTLALLRHPDQAALLAADPAGLAKDAVEELLRFDSPVQVTVRLAFEDVTLGGTLVPAGAQIVIVVGSANRDPDVFPDPDRLDLRRGGESPLSFGGGIHYCLGAALARLEAQVVLPALLRLPDLALACDPAAIVWRDSLTFRSPTSLPVRFRSG